MTINPSAARACAAVLLAVWAFAACVHENTRIVNGDDDGDDGDERPPAVVRDLPPKGPVPYKIADRAFAYFDGRTQSYKRIFIKGVNIGLGVPGNGPGAMAVTEDQYRRWLQRISDAGFNAVRMYTLNPPVFYRVFAEHNQRNPDKPLFLFHGIWLDEVDIVGSNDLFAATAGFDGEIEKVIDCLHGARTVPPSPGRASGTYTADVSPWVIGWIIGREIAPIEVRETNNRHANETTFVGRHVGISGLRASEAWSAARIDHTIDYEFANYKVQRPLSFSSWPTLDPIDHPTEGGDSEEDVETIDIKAMQFVDFDAGIFVNYHAYPYYPNFINSTLKYREATDKFGENTYVGYVADLVRYYGKVPVLVGEVGVPSSWGNAHYARTGMHHGGHSETMQGEYDARLLHNLLETGTAGGLLFAWFDEWWKRTWIVDELTYPRSRYSIRHDLTSPEANFGLIAFDLAPPTFRQFAPVEGTGRIRRVEAHADAAYFHVRITLDRPLAAGDTLTIGYDTYADDLGDTRLPDGTVTRNRNELALVVPGDGVFSQLKVIPSYDLKGIWFGEPYRVEGQIYQSTRTDAGVWNNVVWMNGGAVYAKTGELVEPETYVDTGRMPIRQPGDAGSSLDAVLLEADGRLTARIPWTLMQFSDPTRLRVVHDDHTTLGREDRESEGIAVSVALGADIVETSRFRWSEWDRAPATVEREKPALKIIERALRELPFELPDGTTVP